MITAIDSSVLLAIFGKEPGHEGWIRALEAAARQGELVICPVVYAEISTRFRSEAALDKVLELLAIRLDPFSRRSAWQAGQTFLAYRKAGGPRAHLIPDFLVAAHASCQADRLAAVDRGYLRTWFGKLALLSPPPP